MFVVERMFNKDEQENCRQLVFKELYVWIKARL